MCLQKISREHIPIYCLVDVDVCWISQVKEEKDEIQVGGWKESDY